MGIERRSVLKGMAAVLGSLTGMAGLKAKAESLEAGCLPVETGNAKQPKTACPLSFGEDVGYFGWHHELISAYANEVGRKVIGGRPLARYGFKQYMEQGTDREIRGAVASIVQQAGQKFETIQTKAGRPLDWYCQVYIGECEGDRLISGGDCFHGPMLHNPNEPGIQLLLVMYVEDPKALASTPTDRETPRVKRGEARRQALGVLAKHGVTAGMAKKYLEDKLPTSGVLTSDRHNNPELTAVLWGVWARLENGESRKAVGI